MPIKNPQVIGALPDAPNPADRSTFNTLAYPWSAALIPWTTQTNQAAADTYANAVDSAASATSANSSKNAAAGSASSASEDAGLAAGYRTEALESKNAAAGSASTANTASGQAVTAKNEAQQWATSLTTVSGGLKGARGYANDAAQSAAEAAGIVQGDFGPAIHGADSKSTPDDTDELAIADSGESWSLKKLTWGNLKAATWAAFKVIATGGNAKDTLGLGSAATRDVGSGDEEIRKNSQNDERFVAKNQIKNTTGQSADYPMSQKAVTDAISNAGALASTSATYEYDALGRVDKIVTPDGDTVIGYNLDGQVESVTYPTGRVETFTYDIYGNVISMTATGG